MSSSNNVHNTHISRLMQELHGALLDILVAMNQPQRDEELLKLAGVKLDRALFPLLVGIGRFGPIGIVELADRAGRDYTTVSRQVKKLEDLQLVIRRADPKDRRVHEVIVSTEGKTMVSLLDAAREKIGQKIFEQWEPQEISDLVRLMRKFADAIGEHTDETDEPDKM